MSGDLVEVHCERCERVVRYQFPPETTIPRWLCPECVGFQFDAWVADLVASTLERRV